ncbi:MAG: beta-galactosidase [Bacteroidales bacterium]|nr:beta-galactosidase [Bacteroidales bacterium]
MKRTLFLAALLLMAACSQSETTWAPVGDHIMSRWAAQVDPSAPLPEYPRPQLVREQWLSLNGLWDYAIRPQAEECPEAPDGQILVPFALESALSGVGKHISADEALWYRKDFRLPRAWKGQQILLNFQAVDWSAEVWVNGQRVGLHTGGYTAFSFDITPYLKPKGLQRLVVKVLDATDNDEQPRGKQVSRPSGIWYTPVSGIWQTVWLEPVASETRLTHYSAVPTRGASELSVTPMVENARPGDKVQIRLLSQGALVQEQEVDVQDGTALFAPADVRRWSPEEPFLYDLEFTLKREGKTLDKVRGYAAFREVAEMRDDTGHKRLSLNGKPYFQFGPLDQGWWPDGLYTAPTDEALKYDIEQTKAFGFNMIRKHIKVEPARWYYWCDRLGMLVWQDMPSLSAHCGSKWQQWQWATAEDDSKLTPSAKANYYKEWAEIIAQQQVFPSVVVWVPFNEAWAQFDTYDVVAFTKEHDPSRLVNAASGGNSYKGAGDIFDSHNYPDPHMKFTSAGTQIDVLGEYGGIGWAVEGHLWQPDRNWGYVQYQSSEDVLEQYREYARQLKETIPGGVSAAVYTQTTDVEIEVNGLMTYDRAVTKMAPEALYKINREVIESL